MFDGDRRSDWRFLPAISGMVLTSLVLVGAGLVWAQSGTRSSGSVGRGGGYPQGVAAQERTTTAQRSGARSAPQAPFEQRFWDYLQTVHYRNWAPLPGESADFYPGQSPHGKFLKLYVNRIAAGAPKELPDGSILIKENYGPDSKTLMAVTVMYRVKDYDPSNNDWYWVKYEADGTISQMQGMPIAGKVGTCIDCHRGAGDADFVFTND